MKKDVMNIIWKKLWNWMNIGVHGNYYKIHLYEMGIQTIYNTNLKLKYIMYFKFMYTSIDENQGLQFVYV